MPSDKKPPERATLDLFEPRQTPPPSAPAPTATRADARSLRQTALEAPAPEVQSVALARIEPAALVPVTPSAPVAVQPAVVVETPRVYRVIELVRLAGRALEARFADVWVEGEISNLKVVSGHAYFTLKDAEGQLPSVLFRANAQRVKFRLGDGLKVRARGRLSIYDAQGKFQLYVEALEPVGLGALQLQLEQLKRKLHAEGLFAESRKRPLPFLPRCIGVATSSTGAAVRDIIRVASTRGPARILVAHCQVQGEGAPADIVRALNALERRPEVDLIIVGRGGGSVEDLWAFNDEGLARAIAACRVPVISAVGHEVDYTVADFVADRRAATPSQAAEIAVPVHAELVARLADLEARLGRSVGHAIEDARLGLDDALERAAGLAGRRIEGDRRRLAALEARLQPQHPSARLARGRATLDALRRRLERPVPTRISDGRRALDPLERRLVTAMGQATANRSAQLAPLDRRLHAAMQRDLSDVRRTFGALVSTLDALSPLRVLNRGYGLVRGPGGRLVTRAEDLHPGDELTVRFARGTVAAHVDAVSPEPAEEPPLDAGSPGEGSTPLR